MRRRRQGNRKQGRWACCRTQTSAVSSSPASRATRRAGHRHGESWRPRLTWAAIPLGPTQSTLGKMCRPCRPPGAPRMTAGTMDQCNDSANGRPIDTPGWRTRHTRHWTPVRITHTQRSARKDECMLQTLLACSPTSLGAGNPQSAKRPRPADGSARSFDGLRRPEEGTGTHRQRYTSSTGACSPGAKKEWPAHGGRRVDLGLGHS
jgi:hypothetical protein